MRHYLNAFLSDKKGATAIEYGLIASLMTIVLVASLVLLGAGNGGMWTRVVDLVGGALR